MKLKPLADNILLKQTEAEETTASGIILATTTKEKPAIYEVVSAGPGTKDVTVTVKVTLGPKGRNVVLGKKYGAPLITNDGVSIAKEITLEDPF